MNEKASLLERSVETLLRAVIPRSTHVAVRETSTGEARIEYKGRPLDHSVQCEQEQHQANQATVVPAKLLQPAAPRGAAQPKSKRGTVPMSHPWRRFDFTENSMQAREPRGELCILRK